MPLVKRLIKGSTLTYQEMDDNLSYLDNKVSGSNGYITIFSGSTALTSSLLNQIGSTVFVYGSFNVSQSLTVNNSSVVTLASPSYYIATGSVTASVDVNSSKIFSITSASVNFGQINKTLTNTSFGQETLPASATGYGNAAFGYRALSANTFGIANIAIGYGALLSNTDGDENVAIGGNALEFNTLGSYNTSIGTAALGLNTVDNNTALGYASGFSNVTGSGNVFLGYRAGYNETNSNKLYIANSNTATPLIKGDFGTGLLQLNTPTGTQITGSLITTGNIKGPSLTVATVKSSFDLYPQFKELTWIDTTDANNQFSIYLSGSNANDQVLIQTGTKGLSIDDKLKVVSTGTQITGSLIVSGSARVTGSFAITGSGTLNNCTILTDCDTGSFLKTTSTGFGSTSYYGSFYHTSSQFTSAPNTPTPISMSSTDFAYGISISGSDSDKIKFASGGYYDIQFSAEMAKSTGTSATAYFWIRRNGTDVPWTNTGVTLAGGSSDVATPAWNFFVSASANDYYQLMWSATSTNPFITSSLSVGGGPAVPSIIVTVNRVG